MLYLINAVAFDAKWQTVYTTDQVEQGSFTNAAGEDRLVDFMDSEEHTYISDGSAAGFIKYYQAGVTPLPRCFRKEESGLTNTSPASAARVCARC